MMTKVKKKSPSQQKRDHQRKEKYLARRPNKTGSNDKNTRKDETNLPLDFSNDGKDSDRKSATTTPEAETSFPLDLTLKSSN